MMKEIKKGLKLILYGHGMKLNLIGGFILWMLGIFLFLLPVSGMQFAAVLYIMLGPLMLVQVGYTLLYSGITASSPKKKLIEITIPDFVSAGAGLISYIIVVLCTVFNGSVELVQNVDRYENLLLAGVTMAIILIYYGSAYKYYWLSSVLFFVVLIAGYIAGIIVFTLIDLHLNLISASLICLAILAVGVLLSCFIRRGVYKKTLSPMACGGTLRKALQ